MVTHGCFMIQHFPRDHRIFQRGKASMIYGHPVGLCDVCKGEERASTTESAAHIVSNQTESWTCPIWVVLFSSQGEVPPVLWIQGDRGCGVHEEDGARWDPLLLQGCLQHLCEGGLPGGCLGAPAELSSVKTTQTLPWVFLSEHD